MYYGALQGCEKHYPDITCCGLQLRAGRLVAFHRTLERTRRTDNRIVWEAVAATSLSLFFFFFLPLITVWLLHLYLFSFLPLITVWLLHLYLFSFLPLITV